MTLPSNAPRGLAFIKVIADVSNAVTGSDDESNTAAASITVNPPPLDPHVSHQSNAVFTISEPASPGAIKPVLPSRRFGVESGVLHMRNL